jgi:iron complex outermembrane receptor protein
MTLGARYTWEKKELDSNHVYVTGVLPDPISVADELDISRKFKKLTPSAKLSFRPMQDVLLYASYSRGFKSGGFNTPSFVAPADQVQPETLDAFELGWKTQFAQIRFNGSVFYYDYEDLQVQRTDQNTGGTRVENAATAEIYGIEADLTWAPTAQLELGLGGGYLHTRYDDYFGDAYVPCVQIPSDATCIAQGGLGYAVQANTDYSGETLPQSPKFSGYVRGRYEQPLSADWGTLVFNALLSYSTKFHYNPEHSLREPSRSLLSAGITWTSPSDRYALSVFGDNILDEKYSILKVRQGTGGWRIPGPPATWGVRLSVQF